MLRPPVQSAGWRFLKKFSFAFAWAAFFGMVFGGLAYYRVPLGAADEVQTWQLELRQLLERMELAVFDWRAQALGKGSSRSDDVVLVAIDDEALASAREDAEGGVTGFPWPRDLLGGLSEQLVREGASMVLLDERFSELSPRECGPTRGPSDDESFRARLERIAGKNLLTFTWSADPAPVAERELRPYLLWVDRQDTLEAARASLHRILSARAAAYAIPDGQQVQIWAATTSEQHARALAEAWHLPGGPRIRQRTAADQPYEVPPWELLASIAAVQVEGLDPERLPRVRSLEVPVAPLLSDQSLFGSANLVRDPDGVIRGLSHFVYFTPHPGKGYVLPSAPVVAAMRLAGTRKLAYRDGRLFIGDRYSIPMAPSGYSILRWDAAEAGRGARGPLKRAFSAWKVLVNLRDFLQGRGVAHHDNGLERRVAILAHASTHARELRTTPIGRIHRGAVLGQALVNILQSQGIRRVQPRVDLLLTLGFAVFGAVLAVGFSSVFRARSAPLTYVFSLSVVSGIHLYVARTLFVREQLWVAVAAPLLAMIATFLAASGYAGALERRMREFITRTLGRYVNPEVARRVARDLALMRPERREVSVYLVDLQGSSLLVEEMRPDEVVSLLNDCFSEISAIVARTGGQVDKFVGDAVLSFWGAPVPLARHAEAACECALVVRDFIEAHRAEWEKRYGKRIEFRGAVASGPVVVGDMGSEVKSNYTVIGDAVGRVFLLETLGKRYRVPILAGEGAVEAASGAMLFRELDRVRLDASRRTGRIFELVGRKGRVGEKERMLALYADALAAYRGRRFAEAVELFERCATEFDDPPSALHAARSRYYLTRAPPEDWDGVYDGPAEAG